MCTKRECSAVTVLVIHMFAYTSVSFASSFSLVNIRSRACACMQAYTLTNNHTSSLLFFVCICNNTSTRPNVKLSDKKPKQDIFSFSKLNKRILQGDHLSVDPHVLSQIHDVTSHFGYEVYHGTSIIKDRQIIDRDRIPTTSCSYLSAQSS